jgi:hypothetical protein
VKDLSFCEEHFPLILYNPVCPFQDTRICQQKPHGHNLTKCPQLNRRAPLRALVFIWLGAKGLRSDQSAADHKQAQATR